MLFMGLSSVTTSILNSIGLENKTLFYFIISSGFMLIAVWFLPKFIGVFALLVGFTFVYGITTVFNLILINKTCKIKPKYLKYLSKCCLLCLPTLLFGIFLEKLFLPVIGNNFTFLVVGSLSAIFSVALYFGFGLIDFNFIKEKLPKFRLKKA